MILRELREAVQGLGLAVSTIIRTPAATMEEPLQTAELCIALKLRAVSATCLL